MGNFNDDATCSVCKKPHQGVFTSGPLEGFCARCAWEYDSERIKIEQVHEIERANSEAKDIE